MTLQSATITLLEKAALDNGFDRELPRVVDWLGYASTHAPLEVWLSAPGAGQFVAAISRRDVADALANIGMRVDGALPAQAAAACAVADVATLGRLLRRAYQLARTLPNELLREFENKTASLPRTTEVERLAVQRVGQDIFREGLLEYWETKCAVTGLAVPELLRASHIKPWAQCETDAERLDVFNGLLLAPNLDAAFDKGFITFEDSGELRVSQLLDHGSRGALGLLGSFASLALKAQHRRYLAWHRARVFRRREGA